MDPLLTLNCCSFIVASSCVQCLNVLYLCYLLGNTGNKRTYKEALSDQVNMWVSEPKSSAHHTTILNSRHMITITVSNKNLVDCVTYSAQNFQTYYLSFLHSWADPGTIVYSATKCCSVFGDETRIKLVQYLMKRKYG